MKPVGLTAGLARAQQRLREQAELHLRLAAMDDLRKVGIEDIGLITERRNKPGATAGGK